jgi:hypothetical protein
MLRIATWGTILLLACPERHERVEQTMNRAVGPEEGRVIDLTATGGGTAGVNAAPRELHPRDGHEGCVEMYTVCLPEKAGENCTSARLNLACDELAQIPSDGERVVCRCP